jgi:hypothetical protein
MLRHWRGYAIRQHNVSCPSLPYPPSTYRAGYGENTTDVDTPKRSATSRTDKPSTLTAIPIYQPFLKSYSTAQAHSYAITNTLSTQTQQLLTDHNHPNHPDTLLFLNIKVAIKVSVWVTRDLPHAPPPPPPLRGKVLCGPKCSARQSSLLSKVFWQTLVCCCC